MTTRTLVSFSAVYLLALLPLLPRLSLWLDEILDLHGIRDMNLQQLPAYIASNAGAVPLGYVSQFFLVKLLGYSPAHGRLASAVFSALSCLALGLICRRLRIRHPLLAMALLALCPVQLRYATEARTYAQAICFTLLATLVFTWLIERLTPVRSVLYFFAIVAGVYTQPYTLFVPLAHCLWLAIERRKGLFLVCAGCSFAAAICFLPWYQYANHYWRANLAQEHIRFVFRPRELVLIAHELIGGGYTGAALIALLSAIGFASASLSSRDRWFWASLLGLPFLGPIIADASFGYFLASRQFVFMLPTLAVLAAVGLTALWDRKPPVAGLLLIGLGAVWSVSNFHWFTKPREDWNSPATQLRERLKEGGCAIFVPSNSQPYFEFFEPQLSGSKCSGLSSSRIWLAVSAYDAGPDYGHLRARLEAEGFAPRLVSHDVGPHLELFERGGAAPKAHL